MADTTHRPTDRSEASADQGGLDQGTPARGSGSSTFGQDAGHGLGPVAREVRRPSRATLLTLAAVILVGVALGATAFGLTRGSTSWPVSITRTLLGWRVSGPFGESQQIWDLSGDHLLWNNGAYLEVCDLRRGRATLLQRPILDDQGREMWVSSASLSGDYAVWVAPRNPAGSRVELLAYDLASGRRTSLTTTGEIDSAFACGDQVIWQQGDTIHCRDMRTGLTRTIASGAGLGLTDAADPLVAWTQPGPGVSGRAAHVVAYVDNLQTGVTSHFPVGGPATSFWNFKLAGRSIVLETRGPDHVCSLSVLSLEGRQRRLVVRRVGLGGIAFAANSSDLIWGVGAINHWRLWTEPLDGGPRRRLRGAARLGGQLPTLSDGAMAWTTGSGEAAIETADPASFGLRR